jgi:hypothetical protein
LGLPCCFAGISVAASVRDERSQRHIPETRRIDRQPPAAESPTKQATGDERPAL